MTCRVFTMLGAFLLCSAALAASTIPDTRDSKSPSLNFRVVQADGKPGDKPVDVSPIQKNPEKPQEKPICYKEVNQSNCDCMMYEKTGSSQWRPVDCVADTFCESSDNPC
jgi:hypothetical protein